MGVVGSGVFCARVEDRLNKLHCSEQYGGSELKQQTDYLNQSSAVAGAEAADVACRHPTC